MRDITNTRPTRFGQPSEPGVSLPESPKVKPHLEVESRFFIPSDLASKITRGTPSAIIEQHYFKSSAVKHLIEDLQLHHTVEGVHSLTTARIRRTQAHVTTHELELKGRKISLPCGAIERPEVSLAISEAVYNELLREADGGTLRKSRHDIPGRIYVRGMEISVVAQIDRYLEAGSPSTALPLRFDTIDIEVPDARLIAPLRKGHHSFPFLLRCIEIAGLNNNLQDTLKNRVIAREGFTKRLGKAVQTLEKMAHKLPHR